MTFAPHAHQDCPYDLEVDPVRDVDLGKGNHFYHDVLGCPAECEDDHNHPGVMKLAIIPTPKNG